MQTIRPAHHPVLVQETLEQLDPGRDGLFLDATVGLGGHAEAILESSESSRLLGLDRDEEALAHAARRLERFGERVELVHSDYRDLPRVLEERGNPPLQGVLADLGISSFQIDTAERGFSIRNDGPLDMRMDRSGGRTAAMVIAETPEVELARIFYEYGEERRSRRIAKVIVRERRKLRIETTAALAALVARAAPSRSRRIHPATRVFQALRIHVNEELEGLDEFIDSAVGALAVGGRLAVLTFHSLEDRIVKRRLRWLATRCSCPRSLPRCECGQPNLIRVLTRKPVCPSHAEVAANPRSRSAKLRAAERT